MRKAGCRFDGFNDITCYLLLYAMRLSNIPQVTCFSSYLVLTVAKELKGIQKDTWIGYTGPTGFRLLGDNEPTQGRYIRSHSASHECSHLPLTCLIEREKKRSHTTRGVTSRASIPIPGWLGTKQRQSPMDKQTVFQRKDWILYCRYPLNSMMALRCFPGGKLATMHAFHWELVRP